MAVAREKPVQATFQHGDITEGRIQGMPSPLL